MEKRNLKLLVTAIDFGTTYSGYAFSFDFEFRTDPFKIRGNNWSGDGIISSKAPTTVLFTPEKVFHSFGYEAEDKYAALTVKDEHKTWYYFRRFKMLLHQNETLSRSTILVNDQKKEMRAIEVFSAAIRYLKKHFMDMVHNQVADIREEDVHYVLTVPAIWNDSAKQFMREAANEAGIDSKQLTLALEAEAASIFCKILPVDRHSSQEDVEAFKAGSTYMVLDLGGGTVDVTIHSVNSDGTLSEVTKASGGAWGGTQVDAAFLAFLENIVGTKCVEEFQKNFTADFLELMREFEIKKRNISSSSTGLITIRIPASFVETCVSTNGISVQEQIDSSEYSGRVKFRQDRFQIDAEILKQFFDQSISNTLQHITDIFNEIKLDSVNTILLVGGFAESKIVQDRVKEAFLGKRVIIPSESGLVVLRGAVMFGHNPAIVRCRVSKFTYGIEVQDYENFDDEIPPETLATLLKLDKNLYYKDKVLYYRNVFEAFVHAGQKVPVDSVVTIRFTSLPIDVTEGEDIYTSEEINPKFVTDPGCCRRGKIYLDAPFNPVEIEMRFGGTEVFVQITDKKTGLKRSDCIDFLYH